jgi:hypothetical protein
MDMEDIRKDKNGSIKLGLVAVGVLLASLVGAKVARCVVEPRRAERLLAHASSSNEPDPNRIQPYLDRTREAAEVLRKNNLFVKAPPPQHPVKQVDGILGNEVLIGDKWYKAGDRIGDANIVSVESTQVTVEWNGKKKAFAPLASAGAMPPAPPKRPGEKPAAKEKSEAAEPAKRTDVASVATVVEAPMEEDPLAFLGVDLPPALREKILEMWNSASDEEKARAMGEWNSMSPSEREEALEQLERMER